MNRNGADLDLLAQFQIYEVIILAREKTEIEITDGVYRMWSKLVIWLHETFASKLNESMYQILQAALKSEDGEEDGDQSQMENLRYWTSYCSVFNTVINFSYVKFHSVTLRFIYLH